MKLRTLKDGRVKIHFPGKSHGLLLDLVTWAQQGQQDQVRLELLREIEAKLRQSDTVALRMSEIQLITECLAELPESYAIILSAYLNPQYEAVHVNLFSH